MGEKTACQCRGHRFNPWFEKSAHGMEQLGPCASTEPIRLRAVLPTTEALAPQLEKASSWQQRPPGSANNKQINTNYSFRKELYSDHKKNLRSQKCFKSQSN